MKALVLLCVVLLLGTCLAAPRKLKQADVPTYPTSMWVGLYGATSYEYMQDVYTKIVGMNVFQKVEAYNVSTYTPTYEELLNYDGIMVWGDGSCFYDRAAFGDAVARYVDAGGGLYMTGTAFGGKPSVSLRKLLEDVPECATVGGKAVGYTTPYNEVAECTATDCSNYTNVYQNRYSVIAPTDYTIIKPPQKQGYNVTRGKHQIFEGVEHLDLGDEEHLPIDRHGCPATADANGCQKCYDDKNSIAVYGDGYKWITEEIPGTYKNTSGRAVAMNWNPVSSDAYPGGWNSSTDGARLMVNALYYATDYQFRCFRGGVLLLTDGATSEAEDVHWKVKKSGYFNCTSVWDVSSSTPTYADMQRYGSVLVASDKYYDAAALGDVLHQYATAGGGVVISGIDTAGNMRGKFATEGYLPFTPDGGERNVTGQVSFSPDNTTSELLTNVQTFQNARRPSYKTFTTPPDSSVVASLDMGDGGAKIPLVVDSRKQNTRIIGLNYKAPSSDAAYVYDAAPYCAPYENQNWNASTHGNWITANALKYSYYLPEVPQARTMPTFAFRRKEFR